MLKLCVVGNPNELDHFMNDFKSQPQYDVNQESKEYDICNQEELRVMANVDFKPKVRKSMTVKLQTKEGKELEISLLDGIVVQLDDSVTYVSGRVFDIFA
ncbi:hypothetical protein ACFO25_12780 [Paenactinomyces guangxiensis]|uniref:Uncharacterized protein n=1 Tax=Paenactinomyces guangxiensis TaxID=1490290 RepID=A0A7W1WRG3_9BACL|nr:hypothetical protein [Paenactinomyces guangxiensis]MBA4494608.1 hypothetical protein [Paenactinomyces guangxiensis]MBH8591629.1 hypothetical protein [Paenactinomyces guangxiensis]